MTSYVWLNNTALYTHTPLVHLLALLFSANGIPSAWLSEYHISLEFLVPFTWREAGKNEPEYSYRITLLNLPVALKGSHFLQTHKGHWSSERPKELVQSCPAGKCQNRFCLRPVGSDAKDHSHSWSHHQQKSRESEPGLSDGRSGEEEEDPSASRKEGSSPWTHASCYFKGWLPWWMC